MSFSRPSFSRYCANGGALRARRDGCLPVSPGCFATHLLEQKTDIRVIQVLLEAVPQRMNADALGDAGTPRCQANDPMQLARARMLPAVAGKQPGLTGRHPALLARNAPPFVQYLEQDGRENDVPILLALALLDPDEHPVT